MDWHAELTRLIRTAQAADPTERDGAVMVVLARLRDSYNSGTELALADLAVKFSPWTKTRSLAGQTE